MLKEKYATIKASEKWSSPRIYISSDSDYSKNPAYTNNPNVKLIFDENNVLVNVEFIRQPKKTVPKFKVVLQHVKTKEFYVSVLYYSSLEEANILLNNFAISGKEVIPLYLIPESKILIEVE